MKIWIKIFDCAISRRGGVRRKKEWMKNRFEEGLIFLKANVRENVLLSVFLQNMRGCL